MDNINHFARLRDWIAVPDDASPEMQRLLKIEEAAAEAIAYWQRFVPYNATELPMVARMDILAQALVKPKLLLAKSA